MQRIGLHLDPVKLDSLQRLARSMDLALAPVAWVVCAMATPSDLESRLT